MAARFTQDEAIQIAIIAASKGVHDMVEANTLEPNPTNLTEIAVQLIDAALAIQA